MGTSFEFDPWHVCILYRSGLIGSFLLDISYGTRTNDGCAFMLNAIVYSFSFWTEIRVQDLSSLLLVLGRL